MINFSAFNWKSGVWGRSPQKPDIVYKNCSPCNRISSKHFRILGSKFFNFLIISFFFFRKFEAQFLNFSRILGSVSYRQFLIKKTECIDIESIVLIDNLSLVDIMAPPGWRQSRLCSCFCAVIFQQKKI